MDDLSCVVIMSMTNGPSTFYVDNAEFRSVAAK